MCVNQQVLTANQKQQGKIITHNNQLNELFTPLVLKSAHEELNESE